MCFEKGNISSYMIVNMSFAVDFEVFWVFFHKEPDAEGNLFASLM